MYGLGDRLEESMRLGWTLDRPLNFLIVNWRDQDVQASYWAGHGVHDFTVGPT